MTINFFGNIVTLEWRLNLCLTYILVFATHHFNNVVILIWNIFRGITNIFNSLKYYLHMHDKVVLKGLWIFSVIYLVRL
jgi:hypothetical protein